MVANLDPPFKIKKKKTLLAKTNLNRDRHDIWPGRISDLFYILSKMISIFSLRPVCGIQMVSSLKFGHNYCIVDHFLTPDRHKGLIVTGYPANPYLNVVGLPHEGGVQICDTSPAFLLSCTFFMSKKSCPFSYCDSQVKMDARYDWLLSSAEGILRHTVHKNKTIYKGKSVLISKIP